jgi:AAA+ superfamily predicted ATPase
MPQLRVIIGPFDRQVFAEGLASLLQEEPDLEVSLVEDERDAVGLMDSPSPVIVILQIHEGADHSAFLPRSDAVAVILISAEGRDMQIALKQVDRSRLRAAIRLVSEVPYPRVISLDMDAPSQAPFMLPKFRHAETSGLSQVIAWLDAVFARALSEVAGERTAEGAAGWLGDLQHLVRGFSGCGKGSRDEKVEPFDAVMTAPGWPVRLIRLFALDQLEMQLLCLTAAPDLDQRYAQAIGILQNDYATPRPNATTLARLIGASNVGADVTALMEGRRAFARLQMIRAEEQGMPQPGYRVAPHLLALMTGVRRKSGRGWRLQLDALPAEENLAAQMAEILEVPSPPLILAMGEGIAAGDEVAAAVVAGSGARVMRVDCAELAEGDAGRAVLDRALAARLSSAVLMIENFEELSAARKSEVLGADIAGLVRGAIVVASYVLGVAGDAVAVRVKKPSVSLVARRWRVASEERGLTLSGDAAQRLGGALKLPIGDIEAVAQLAAGRRRVGAEASDEELILEAARGVSTRHAPETVRRAPSVFGWDDIVLPESVKRQIVCIPEQVRHSSLVLDDWDFASRLPYGRGVGALFSGPSGTGKTMCAQVIARALGVELMQVELSRCISKYIGETEKNIDRCFAAAEASSTVLLFDESDALFGKRTEIKDAHDRYANVEVAYLLQRIEAYEGLVILTTNLKSNIDSAFLRRLRFVVDFPMPDAADRERIWQVVIPEATRCAADVDTAFLARRLPLSGGSIQSVAVNAAFGAAAEGCGEIHMRHIMVATRAELVKNGMFGAEKVLADYEPCRLEGTST